MQTLSTGSTLAIFFNCILFPQGLLGWSVCLWPRQWGPQRSSSPVTHTLSKHASQTKWLMWQYIIYIAFSFFSNPRSSCSDLFPERLTMAKECGADFQLTVKRGEGPQQLAKSVEDLLGDQPHITIECTGVESSIQTAIYVGFCLQKK